MNAKAKAKPQPQSSASALSKDINPSHYVINTWDVNGKPVQLEVVDLIEALCPQDAHMAHAFTYLLRAGRKAQSTYIKDVLKCAWWCIRAASFHDTEIDLRKEFGSATLGRHKG